VNKGTTFEPIFGGETTIISGEIDIAACNPDIIWVGTDDQRIRHLGYAKKG
jgi:hypothetical protein